MPVVTPDLLGGIGAERTPRAFRDGLRRGLLRGEDPCCLTMNVTGAADFGPKWVKLADD